MHRDRQGQVRDPRQHGQRHQARLRAVVDEAGFPARAEPAHVPPHKTVDQADNAAVKISGSVSTRTSRRTRNVRVVKAAAIR